MPTISSFGKMATGLAKNPLGIIALFIVLIYGFASLVVGFSDKLISGERIIIIWFLAISPCFVLAVFGWLVSRHHTKLYAPSDYREDQAFIQASQESLQAAVSLGAATAKWAAEGASEEEIQKATFAAAANIARVTSPRKNRKVIPTTILWVDDRPSNNIFERQALTSAGIRFVLSTSTEDALSQLQQTTFDTIISDMGRPPDKRAGYTLLQKLRKNGIKTPFLIYASEGNTPENALEAKRMGAQGTTNRPDELYEMVLSELRLNQ